MKRAALLAIVCLVLAAPAAAAIGPWTPASIKALVRSVGYPKPHPKKLVCKQRSAASFKCTATYRRKQVFYVWLDRGSESSATSGGWLCAGKKLASCKILGVGFIPAAESADNPHLEAAIRFLSEAYVEIRYHVPYPTTYGGCTYTDTPLVETCIYAKPDVTVTITAKPAKSGGYLVRGTT